MQYITVYSDLLKLQNGLNAYEVWLAWNKWHYWNKNCHIIHITFILAVVACKTKMLQKCLLCLHRVRRCRRHCFRVVCPCIRLWCYFRDRYLWYLLINFHQSFVTSASSNRDKLVTFWVKRSKVNVPAWPTASGGDIQSRRCVSSSSRRVSSRVSSYYSTIFCDKIYRLIFSTKLILAGISTWRNVDLTLTLTLTITLSHFIE